MKSIKSIISKSNYNLHLLHDLKGVKVLSGYTGEQIQFFPPSFDIFFNNSQRNRFIKTAKGTVRHNHLSHKAHKGRNLNGNSFDYCWPCIFATHLA